MALLNVFFKRQRTKIGNIQIDATISEKHTAKGVLSENPIEDGEDVGDHFRLMNLSYQVEGVITNNPSTFSLIDTDAGIVTSLFGRTNRALDAHKQFMDLRKKRDPIDVYTGLQKYSSMMIEEYIVDRKASTANAIFFTMLLKQANIVSSSTVPQENLKANARRGASTKNLGTKTTDQVPENEPLSTSPSSISTKTQKSDLSKLFGKFKGLF